MTVRDVPPAARERTVATTERWRARGISPGLMRSLVRSGDLVRMRRGVYATRNAVDWAAANQARGHALRVYAMRATVGSAAVASHQSAALLHDLDVLTSPGETVTLTLPPARPWNRPASAGVVFHTADLPPGHLTTLYDLPVTTAARTVIDLARMLPFMDGVVVADSALHAERAAKPELRQILDSCASWPGVRRARRVVAFADERAGSALESVARVVFDEFGLEPPELQATVHLPRNAFLVDFSWPEHRVIAEADGLAKYTGGKVLIAQFERDRLLRDAGYKVVHFTWQELFETPDLVITRIRQAFGSASAY